MEDLENFEIDSSEDLININKNFVDPIIIKSWKKWFLSQGHSLESCITYESFIKRFIGLGIKVNQKSTDIFMESHSNSVSSSALKSLFKFLVFKKKYSNDLLNIRFERNKQTKRLPKSISYTDIQTIIKNMRSTKTKILTEFIFELALRVSEAFKVTYSDFNWSDWLLNKNEFGKLNLKDTKKRGFGVIPVKPELMNLIYESHKGRTSTGIPIGNNVFWVSDFNRIIEFLDRKEYSREQNQHDYLDYSKRTYRKELSEVSKEVIGKSISIHTLRHSKAQLLMDRGMPIESIKEVLRHSQISSTEIYAQASPEKVKKDLKAYDIFKESQMNNEKENSKS